MSDIIHTHILTPGLVQILIKLIQAVKQKNKNEVHLQKDVDLTHNEYANAQKLRYFGLIAKTGNPGYWLITERGGKFLRNEIAVSYKVSTQNNHIVAKSEEVRMIKDYFPAYGDVWFQQNFGSIKITNQQALL